VISGVYVPLLTAFDDEGGRVLPGACAGHARWLVEAGVDGVVPFGTSGEGPSLSLQEKRDVLAALVAELPGVPVLPAITDVSLDGALQLVEIVNDLPVAGVLLLPPYYYRPVSGDGLRRFAEPVLAASRHPVLLYHIPEMAPGVPVQTVADLPVWGVKDSGGELSYTRAVLAAGKQVMVGAEHTIIDAISAGAAGTIPALSNVLPEHLLAACAAARSGDVAAAREIIAQALEFRSSMLAVTGPLEWISALKMIAERRHGLSLGGVRAPLPAAPAAVAGLEHALHDAVAGLAAVS
jgi:dihydrodipicolinate synthase/N-acetylneuraminate lyase